jgi:hypothetical protein
MLEAYESQWVRRNRPEAQREAVQRAHSSTRTYRLSAFPNR